MAVIATVIEAHNPAVMDYMIYPEQNPMNQMFIQQQFSAISGTLNEIGKKFIEGSRELYAKINDSDMIKRAKAAIRAATGIHHVNEFSYYETLQELQNASPFMQNFLMANPTVTELHNKQQCDGYSDTYVDTNNGAVGAYNYHFRRVMDGVVEFDNPDTLEPDEERPEFDWKLKVYMEDTRPGDRELEISEKAKVISTWEVMNAFIKAGQDPTNPRGGSL